jgi:alpha-mannosidase
VDAGPSPSLHITSGKRRVASVPLGPCVIVTSADVKERSAARVIMKALLSQGVTCIHRLDTHDPEDDPAASGFRISLGRRNAYSSRLLQQAPQAASRLSEPNGNPAWSGVLLSRPDPENEWPPVPVLIADSASNGDLTHVAEALAEAISKDQLALPEARDFSELASPADEHGLALLNRGSLTASLESDGTLVAPLFHTSAWSTHPWGEGRLDRFFIPEHKSHIYEHALFPHQGDWREAGVVHLGYEYNTPLRAVQTAVREGALPTAFGLVSSDSPDLIITAVKPLGNPLAGHRPTAASKPENGILIRAYESAGKHTSASLHFASEPQAAWTTDLLERKLEDIDIVRSAWRRAPDVTLDVPACGIISVAVQLPPPTEPGPPKDLGPSAEPYLPVHSRYWDHNLGAAPMGNLPLSLWIRGPVPVGQNTRFALGLVNDSLDQEITGTVNMIAPETWTMIPRQLPYRIPPNSPALYEVMVVVPEDAPGCFIRAVTEQRGQIVQDVFPVGDVAPLQASLLRGDGTYTVRIANPNADYVEGHVTLITPIESWGETVEGVALGLVAPLLHPFRLEAGSQQELHFTVEGDHSPAWAIAKVCWYGNIHYVQETVAG